jgi:arylsulfatase A-like enzyme
MKRKPVHRAAFFLLVALFGMPELVAADASRRPNILVILADDMGLGDLGCYGGRQAPAADRSTRKGGDAFHAVLLASPICSPSRAGIITGMYPARWRITSFRRQKGQRGLRDG